MISYVLGSLLAKDLDRIEILTAGGVGYEMAIPLGVYEKLPAVGEEAALHTHLVVRDDAWMLFGFSDPFERRVFQRLLTAGGVGPALALGMLSALSAERLVRAIVEGDVATLQSVPRVGRKKAERIILDLADKLGDVSVDVGTGPRPGGAAADDALRALVSLGYNTADAEKAVRAALDGGGRGVTAPELIRLALTKVDRR
ncbi:MAG TPA: Holliday junction branch migration protein RuvA [Gemmatimonadaceae bacterium]|jgi:Holliday junction DNA helicase, RuvA subunit